MNQQQDGRAQEESKGIDCNDERRAHPGDRRKHAVHLTASGRRTLHEARQVAIEMAKEMFAPLSAREVETLRRLLRKLAGVER